MEDVGRSNEERMKPQLYAQMYQYNYTPRELIDEAKLIPIP